MLALAAGCTTTSAPAAPAVSTSTVASATATRQGSQPSGVIELPSQTGFEATRDGVPPAVARLTLNARIAVVASVPAVDGVWVASRLPAATVGAATGGVLGDSSGPYGSGWVKAQNYGEVLLLNSAQTSILRAYPLPGIWPQRLLVTDDAVYAEHQADAASPVSMLCRIDRHTLAALVRIFPATQQAAPSAAASQLALPAWLTAAPTDPSFFEAIKASGSQVWISGPNGQAQLDPATLALRRIIPTDSAQRALTTKVRSYLQTAPAFTNQLAAAAPTGRVLCGIRLWGTSATKHEIYADALCGLFAAVDGVATEVSAEATPIVLTTAGPPATTAIVAFKVPGNDAQWGLDVRAWFPPDIADQILYDPLPTDLDETDLLIQAQSLFTAGQSTPDDPASS